MYLEMLMKTGFTIKKSQKSLKIESNMQFGQLIENIGKDLLFSITLSTADTEPIIATVDADVHIHCTNFYNGEKYKYEPKWGIQKHKTMHNLFRLTFYLKPFCNIDHELVLHVTYNENYNFLKIAVPVFLNHQVHTKKNNEEFVEEELFLYAEESSFDVDWMNTNLNF